MRLYLLLLLSVLSLAAHPVAAAQAENSAGESRNCRTHRSKMDFDADPPWCKKEGGGCSPAKRGRCGKRRGDWYGARQSVATAAQARGLLLDYFAGQEYTVSEVVVKRWGFRADVLDKNGKVVDQVMIDKRSGRIRSLY